MVATIYNLKLYNEELRKNLYTGQWQFETESGHRWLFYFRLGRLIWCEQLTHDKDPLFRYLQFYCPEREVQLTELEPDVTEDKGKFLIDLYQRKFLNKDTLATIIMGIAKEFLFDIIQLNQTETILETQPSKEIPSSFPPLSEIDPILKAVERNWQEWQNAGLASYSPNLYPIIQNESSLKRELFSIMDGCQTLRELAWNTNQNLLDLANHLIPFINYGAITLSEKSSIKSNINKHKEANPVQLKSEKKVILEAIIKKFRGTNYLEEPLNYQTSIEEVKRLLQQGNTVKLVINFYPQENITNTLANQFFNNCLLTLQDCAEVEQVSDLKDSQLIIWLSSALAINQQSLEINNNSFPEQTLTLEVIVKQFRGNSYLQEPPSFHASIHEAQDLLQKGNTVKLMVNFQNQKNIDMTLVNQLLNRVVQQFPNWVEVKLISTLQDKQMMIQLSPQKIQA